MNLKKHFPQKNIPPQKEKPPPSAARQNLRPPKELFFFHIHENSIALFCYHMQYVVHFFGDLFNVFQ